MDNRRSAAGHRRPRKLIFAILLSAILLSTGCNALKRGDYYSRVEETLLFREIGFLAADNIALYRNAMAATGPEQSTIYISIPYYEADGITPLVPSALDLTFETVGTDVSVYYDLDGFTAPLTSPHTVPFHDGASTPQIRTFMLEKTDSNGNTSTNYITVELVKTITPYLENPHQVDTAAPLTLKVAFDDERGDKIDMTAGGGMDPGLIYWDSWRLDMPDAPTYNAVDDVFDVTNVRPYYPEEHTIEFDSSCYIDNNGYSSQWGRTVLTYDPPAIHLSNATGSPGDGDGSQDDPFYSWTDAFAEFTAVPGTYNDIFIEATNIPYDMDTAGGVLIDTATNGGTYVNIYGGYKSGFNGRYDEYDDNRPLSILYNSQQAANGAGMTFNGVGSDYILSNVAFRSADVVDGSAVIVEAGGTPRMSGCDFFAYSGGSNPGRGLSLLSGASPNIGNARILGKEGGTADSYGIYVDNSTLDLHDSIVSGGNVDGAISYGVYGLSSSLYLNWVGIIAGLTDPGNDYYTESSNYGVFSSSSYLEVNGFWVHAASATTDTAAVRVIGNGNTRIEAASLVASESAAPAGIDAAGTGSVEVYNSAIRVDSYGTTGTARGAGISTTGTVRLSGNAIRVAAGTAATYGVDAGTSGNIQLHNNLIWSENASNMLGIRSGADISTMPIRHNNVWHAGTTFNQELTAGTQQEFRDWYLNNGVIHGNISYPVSVDMNYSYTSEDFDMGRISGTVPGDVAYGGEDISGIMAPSPPTYDREYNSRTAEAPAGPSTIGWSIGPYERDGYLPTTVYVSTPADGGSDGHGIGSRQNPFESLQRAWQYVSTMGAFPVTIRVSEGTHTLAAAIPFNSDVTLSGGWSSGFGSRDIVPPLAYETTLEGSLPNLIDISGVSDAFLLEGFVLRNHDAGGNTINIDSAFPVIRSNVILPMNSGGVMQTGVYIRNGSAPEISRNHIYGGDGANNNFGIYLDVGDGTRIFNNVIHGGNNATGDSYGLYIQNGGDNVRIYNNTVFAGQNGANRSFAMGSSGGGRPDIVNNMFIASRTSAVENHGVVLLNALPSRFRNNIILSGPTALDAFSNPAPLGIDYMDMMTPGDLEADLNAAGTDAADNRIDAVTDPAAPPYFQNFIPGADTDDFYKNEDWSLSGDSIADYARTGGMNLEYEFTTDRNGNSRSAPWSIGAYE